MDKINAVITGVGGYVPEDVLTNEDISKMVDTTDEWIMTRVGIKERRILKGEGVGLSYMGIRAVKQLLEKTNLNPEEVEVILTATTTPDHHFPTTSSIIAYHTGCKNAMTFDMQGACAGFLYALETGANYIRSGRYKKVVVVSGDKMTSITDYQDRSTCPLFGDACGAVLLEPTTEEFGILDTILRTDGVGYPHLIMKSGGSAYPPSHETVDNREHFVYQDGRVVFKYAVSYMADVAAEIAEKNGLTHDDIAWIVPHQANLRIIDATAKRLGVDMDKVMINIQKYGNTSAGTIPICLWEWENQLKKGDNLILAAFGAGFTWGAVYLKWGYDGKKHKSGFVNIVGNPNVGKSTLMNRLVGERISIITSKAQTTRHRIMGIVNTDDMQIVYSDTPGVLRPNYKLQESMLNFSQSALGDADVLLYVTDVVETIDKNNEFLARVQSIECPVLLLINKIDQTNQPELEKLVAQWKELLPKAEIIPISALSNFNIDYVKRRVEELMPDSPPYFEKDALTDKPARFFVTEIIREKILLYYQKEIPYAVEVVVELFKEDDELIHIKALIIVERDTQKGIIIGHQGQALKKVGAMARKDIERFFGKKVFLEMFVKVEKDWRNRDNILKNFGYQLD